MSVRGHFWTIAPRLRHGVRPRPAPEARLWETTVLDPVTGEVPVTGLLREAPGSEDLLVLVHGLGGGIGSHYMLRAARAAEAAGISCLRLNLRGCDRRSGDFYHAGLTADLHAALASEELQPPTGGTTRSATPWAGTWRCGWRRRRLIRASPPPPRSARRWTSRFPSGRSTCRRAGSTAAICWRASTISTPPWPPAGRCRCRWRRRSRLRTLREWDDRIVAPRFGFAGADDYYARASVAPRLGDLRIPALLLNSETDPMVPARPSAPP